MFTEIHNEWHVVLHNEDGAAFVAEGFDHFFDVLDQCRVDSSGGFVEKDELGVDGFDAQDFEELLLSV